MNPARWGCQAFASLHPASGFPPASPVSVRRSRSAIAPEWPTSAASDSCRVDRPSSGRRPALPLLLLTCRNASFRFARSHMSSRIRLVLAGRSDSFAAESDSMSSRPACRASPVGADEKSRLNWMFGRLSLSRFIDDPFHSAARFVQVGSSAVKPTQAGRRGIHDGGERLVYFMGDRSCHLSQRRYACYVCELHLGIEEALLACAQFLFRPLAVGHVDDKDNPLVWFPLEK